MKRPLLLIWLSAIYVLSGWSQDTIRLYLDSNFVGVEEGHAVIVRQAILNEGIYHITDQHVDGNMIFSGEYSSINPWIENGIFYYYNDSGKIYATGGYKNGFLSGTWIYFEEDKIDSINYDSAERMLKSNVNRKKKYRANSKITPELMRYIGRHLHFPPRGRDISENEKVTIKLSIQTDNSITTEIIESRHQDFSYEAARVLLDLPDSVINSLSIKSRETTLVFDIPFRLSDVLIFVDEQARFQGGDITDFREWVQKNLVYPPDAVMKGHQGLVIIQFVVQKDGRVGRIKMLKSSGYEHLDNEAIRVIGNSPLWEPAAIEGMLVSQQFVIPVYYRVK